MPITLRGRRRRRNLREKVLSQRDDDENSSFLNSTPASLKGSFLRNKLENPIFRSLFGSKRVSKTSSDLESVSESSVYSGSTDEGEEEQDPRIELEQVDEPKWSLFGRKKRGNRFGASFFDRSGLFSSKPKRSPLRKLQRLSSDSSKSSDESSRDSSSEIENENETDVDVLTKLEEDEPTFLLFTKKGEPVRTQFFSDYLLLSPVEEKRKKRRQKEQKKKTTIYYEDLALWTNNDECLKLVHVVEKHTAQQQRSEIKLFVNKKKPEVHPEELNSILKDKVSVLMSERLGVDLESARQELEQTVTQTELDRVVEEIDRDAEKRLAKTYTNALELI